MQRRRHAAQPSEAPRQRRGRSGLRPRRAEAAGRSIGDIVRAVLSVLLPARNAAPTLAAALEGLFAQRDAPEFEIVCVDDASSDATPRILAEARARDPRVR
ncbi:MAG: glycosyltransferase family 2 protein, partial [Myxococcales bacterium]